MDTIMVETNSGIFPIINVNTYDSLLSFYDLFGDSIEEDEKDGYIVCDDFDFDEYKKAICVSAQSIFDEEKPMEEWIHSFHVKGIDSPREYNFRTDWLLFTVELDRDFLDKALEYVSCESRAAATRDFIRDHWESRDGFISFMPESLDELRDDVGRMKRDAGFAHSEECRIYGGLLELIMETSGIGWENATHDPVVPENESLPNMLTELLIEDMYGNHTAGDFCTVVDPDDIKAEFGRNRLRIDSRIAKLKRQRSEYAALMAGNKDAIARADNWLRVVTSELNRYRERECEALSHHWDKFDKWPREKILQKLHKISREIRSASNSWAKFWRLPS